MIGVCACTSLSAQVDPIAKVRIQGTVQNGTFGESLHVSCGKQSCPDFPEIELIALNQGMQILEKQRLSPDSRFIFQEIALPRFPLLLRCIYKKTSYTLLIPPKASAWKQKHVLKVYERSDDTHSLRISSALWVTKLESKLKVDKIFALENQAKPPQSLSLEHIHFYIPKNGEKLSASLRYQESQVPLPLRLKLKNGDKGSPAYYTIASSMRPGAAELSVSYELPGYIFEDYFPQQNRGKPQPIEGDSKAAASLMQGKADAEPRERLLIWRPLDVEPELRGATYKKVQVPNLSQGYRVLYPQEGKVLYDFSRGSFIVPDPLNAYKNFPFDTPAKTLASLFFCLIFLILVLNFTAKTKKLG